MTYQVAEGPRRIITYTTENTCPPSGHHITGGYVSSRIATPEQAEEVRREAYARATKKPEAAHV